VLALPVPPVPPVPLVVPVLAAHQHHQSLDQGRRPHITYLVHPLSVLWEFRAH